MMHAKVSLTASSAPCNRKHVTAMYVPESIMPLKSTYKPNMPISAHVPIWQLCQYIGFIWTHSNEQCNQEHWYTYFTLLAYVPKQICPPHCIYMSHSTSTVVYIDPSLLYSSIKIYKLHLFPHTTIKYVPATNMSLKCQKYHRCLNYLMCIHWKSMPMYMSQMKLFQLMM